MTPRSALSSSATKALCCRTGSRGIRQISTCKHVDIFLITTADIRNTPRSLRSRSFIAHSFCLPKCPCINKQACHACPFVKSL